jgi:O-antigen/teichoic acid export membrane protein
LKNFKNLLLSFYKNSFVLNFFHSLFGNTISFLIPILFAPVITRLYSPVDYGNFALFNTLYNLFSIICTGMYSSAIMVENKNKKALNLYVGSIIISVFTSFIPIFIYLFIFKTRINGLINLEQSVILSFLILLYGINSSTITWLSRLGKFKEVSYSSIIYTLILSILTLIYGLNNYKINGLVYSLLIAQVIYSILLVFYFIKFNSLSYNHIKFRYIFQIIKKYDHFPKYNLILGILDGLADNLLVFFISFFLGKSVLGSYSLARSIILKPLQLFGNSINNVYFKKISEQINNKINPYLFTLKSIKYLLLLASPFLIILIVFGHKIFNLFFGSQWFFASTVSLVLIPRIIIQYLNSSISSIPLVTNNIKQNTIISFITNYTPILFFIFFGIYVKTPLILFGIFSTSSFITGFILLSWYLKILRNLK